MNRVMVGFAITMFIGIIWASTGLLTLAIDSGLADFLTGLVITAVGVIGFDCTHHLIEQRREEDARLVEGRALVWLRRDIEAGR